MRAVPSDLAAVCRRMRGEREVALVVHEKPDLDAFGAAVGMLDLFDQLGVAASLYIDPAELLPSAAEAFVPMNRVKRAMPSSGLPLYAVDCARFERIALPIHGWEAPVVNIDHHHDNPGYGDFTFVRGGVSSTCELICDLAEVLSLSFSPEAATALYAGLSFDSGHFHYESTSARTFACASWLRELGVDVTAVYGQLYEQRSFGSLRLLSRH